METAHLIKNKLKNALCIERSFQAQSKKKKNICREVADIRNGEIIPAGGDDRLLQPSCKSPGSLTTTSLWAHRSISKWRKSIIKHVSGEFRSSLWRPDLTITPRITQNTWGLQPPPNWHTRKHFKSIYLPWKWRLVTTTQDLVFSDLKICEW